MLVFVFISGPGKEPIPLLEAFPLQSLLNWPCCIYRRLSANCCVWLENLESLPGFSMPIDDLMLINVPIDIKPTREDWCSRWWSVALWFGNDIQFKRNKGTIYVALWRELRIVSDTRFGVKITLLRLPFNWTVNRDVMKHTLWHWRAIKEERRKSSSFNCSSISFLSHHHRQGIVISA